MNTPEGSRNQYVTRPFNFDDWAAKSSHAGSRLSVDTTRAVSSFTLLWNLFEDTVLGNDASSSRFKKLAESKFSSAILSIDSEIAKSLEYWRMRYYAHEDFNARFDTLNFRKNDSPQYVKQVMVQFPSISEIEGATATMLILYRIRNNLFHGLKSYDQLNEQCENLNCCCYCLGEILKRAN